jgi:hypothetical protein
MELTIRIMAAENAIKSIHFRCITYFGTQGAGRAEAERVRRVESVATQERAALRDSRDAGSSETGAYLEFVYVKPGSDEAQAHVKAIRAVGPEYRILASDLGQANTPLHPSIALHRLSTRTRRLAWVCDWKAIGSTGVCRTVRAYP